MNPEEVERFIYEEWSDSNREYPVTEPEARSCADCKWSLWHPDSPVAWCMVDEEWYSIEDEMTECWEE